MKVHEIFEAKKSTNQNMEEYIDDLIGKHKLKKIGTGYYSTVFDHPSDPNIAVKVMAGTEFGAALHYLKFAEQKWKSNPWLPQIYSIHEYHHKDDEYDEYQIIFMEKLKPISKLQFKEFFASELGVTDDSNPEFYNGLNIYGKSLIKKAIKHIKDKNLKQVFDYFLKHAEALDLKVDNLMLRGNQIVLADPVGG